MLQIGGSITKSSDQKQLIKNKSDETDNSSDNATKDQEQVKVGKSDKKLKSRPPCQFCGKPSKNVMFAAYVCGSEGCLNKAMDERGGPAGHKKDPNKWLEENK